MWDAGKAGKIFRYPFQEIRKQKVKPKENRNEEIKKINRKEIFNKEYS